MPDVKLSAEGSLPRNSWVEARDISWLLGCLAAWSRIPRFLFLSLLWCSRSSSCLWGDICGGEL
jgi:hypothetical protein